MITEEVRKIIDFFESHSFNYTFTEIVTSANAYGGKIINLEHVDDIYANIEFKMSHIWDPLNYVYKRLDNDMNNKDILIDNDFIVIIDDHQLTRSGIPDCPFVYPGRRFYILTGNGNNKKCKFIFGGKVDWSITGYNCDALKKIFNVYKRYNIEPPEELKRKLIEQC